MKKIILVGLAILTVSTSAALAAHRTHHGHAMKPNASAAAANPNVNVFGVGGASPVSGRAVCVPPTTTYISKISTTPG